jgi:hypothetical protein
MITAWSSKNQWAESSNIDVLAKYKYLHDCQFPTTAQVDFCGQSYSVYLGYLSNWLDTWRKYMFNLDVNLVPILLESFLSRVPILLPYPDNFVYKLNLDTSYKSEYHGVLEILPNGTFFSPDEFLVDIF